MRQSSLLYGIPNIQLVLLNGHKINPAHLAGHELVVVYCATDRERAESEIDSYRALADDFEQSGARLIGVIDGAEPSRPVEVDKGPAIACDPDGSGWSAFQALLPLNQRQTRAPGGTFYFGRGGSLVQSWIGGGRARDVLDAILRRR